MVYIVMKCYHMLGKSYDRLGLAILSGIKGFPQRDENSLPSSNDLHVLDILNEMRRIGLENAFIYSLMEYCQRYEGIRDLMEMWYDEVDLKERDNIVADLQESLDDITPSHNKHQDRPQIDFDDLEEIKNNVVEFKNQLRREVDRQGGISELARRTGIPQPSLSRFFSSSAMPRRTTLFKIVQALTLSKSSIEFKWVR